MADKSLSDRANRLKLAYGQEKPNKDAAEASQDQQTNLGPPHANEQWRNLYARISEAIEGLRR